MSILCYKIHHGTEICGKPGEAMPKEQIKHGLGKRAEIGGRIFMPKESKDGQ